MMTLEDAQLLGIGWPSPGNAYDSMWKVELARERFYCDSSFDWRPRDGSTPNLLGGCGLAKMQFDDDES